MEKFISVTITLLMILDPIGNVPVINAMLSGFDKRRRQVIIIRESLLALVIMFVFLLFGNIILKIIGVEKESISMAGGVVLFLIGLSMSFPSKNDLFDENSIGKKGPLLVPLATPLIAGPGVLSVLLLIRYKVDLFNSVLALLAAGLISLIILLLGETIVNFLGKRGTEACKRLIGLVLILIAVNMFMSGLRAFFMR